MHAIVSFLPEQQYRQVERLWTELQGAFSVRGVYITPYPHFSYHVAQHYDLDKVVPVLKRIASNIATFQVRTSGIGIFTSASPIIYIRVVRSLELSQLNEEIWKELSSASPAQWMPHITIGFGDITSENLPGIMHWLSERDFTWEFTVDNLAIIYDTDGKQELHSRYDIKNKPVPGPFRMERLQAKPLSREKLERVLKVREEIIAHTDGVSFEDSTEAVRRMREERTEYLMQLRSEHPLDNET
jgi:hypothetical protein